MKRTTILLWMGAFLAVCGYGQSSRDADIRTLKDLEAQWNKEFAAKDAEKLVAHYADDATLMSPGMPAATGKDAIRAVLKEMVGDPNLSLHFQADRVEIARSGEMGFTQGTYHLSMTDPKTKQKMSDQGSYVTIYRKQADGSWKAVSDIASSGPPMSTR